MVTLSPVHGRQRQTLFALLQAYLQELSIYYGNKMDESGVFSYPYFDAYFIDPYRHAFFMKREEKIMGFAMINRYSALGEEIDYAVAEFYILPQYRHRGYAKEAALALFNRFPGRWEIKHHIDNRAAACLWSAVTAAFSAKAVPVSEDERVLTFSTP